MRPKFVLFGSSIVQYNHYGEGWGATLAHLYGRKVLFFPLKTVVMSLFEVSDIFI